MKLLQFFISTAIVLSGCAVVPAEQYGFIYSYGFNSTYNSFTQTFTQKMCGARSYVNFKVSLAPEELETIQKSMDKNQILILPQEISSTPEDTKDIVITSPCPSNEILIQKGTELNRVRWGCYSMPDDSEKYIKQAEEVGHLIRSILYPKINSLDLPATGCRYY